MTTSERATEWRKSGISVIGSVRWGTHFCYFYETKQDLLDTLVLYFKAGLENSEFCLWVVSQPLTVEEAKRALGQTVSDLDRHLAEGNIEFHGDEEWYLQTGRWEPQRVLQDWRERLNQALARGYPGLRVSGDTAWIQKDDWIAFREYEKELDTLTPEQRWIILCTYPLTTSPGDRIFDVARSHQVAMARRRGEWEVLETSSLKAAKEEVERLNATLEQRVEERTRELAATNDALRTEIVERKEAEDELRHSQADLAEGQRMAKLGSWSFDIASNALRWSEELLRIFDVEVTEFGGKYETFLGRVHPEDRPRVLQVNHEARAGRDSFDVAYRVVTRSGEVKTVREVGHTRKDPAGKVVWLFGTAQDITERKQAESALRRSQEQLRALAARLQQVREEEQTRIAREIHDELGAKLTGLKMDLQWMESRLEQIRDERLRTAFEDKIIAAVAVADETMATVQRIAAELRPAMLDSLGLISALRHEATQFESRTAIRVTLDLPADDPSLDGAVSTAAYRIVQEILTNVTRHAQATEVRLSLQTSAGHLHLTVQDNGRGVSPEDLTNPRSLGLLGMQERAAMVNGTVQVEGAPGQGTTVRLEIPIPTVSADKKSVS